MTIYLTNLCPVFSGQASALVYRHRVELDGLLEDSSFCVVFTLIYDVAEAPTSKDKRVGSYSICQHILFYVNELTE